MKATLPLKEYVTLQMGNEHAPVSMQELFKPFEPESETKGEPDEVLVMGNIIESLESEFTEDDFIDPIDVAATAYSLGYEEAAYFLDDTPWLSNQETHKSSGELLH